MRTGESGRALDTKATKTWGMMTPKTIQDSDYWNMCSRAGESGSQQASILWRLRWYNTESRPVQAASSQLSGWDGDQGLLTGNLESSAFLQTPSGRLEMGAKPFQLAGPLTPGAAWGSHQWFTLFRLVPRTRLLASVPWTDLSVCVCVFLWTGSIPVLRISIQTRFITTTPEILIANS